MKPLTENLSEQVNWTQYVYLNNCIAGLVAQTWRHLYHPLENGFLYMYLFKGMREHWMTMHLLNINALSTAVYSHEVSFWLTNLAVSAQFNTFTT